jgi:predicted secreted hydrolase
MERRAFLLAALGLGQAARAEGPPGAAQQGVQGAGAQAPFAAAVPGRALVFPRDFGAHPEFRTEWWYVTGWLRLADGTMAGFQLTFFRVRTGLAADNPSAFAPRQLLLAHAAIADPRVQRLRVAERAARTGFGRAEFSTARTAVTLGDWRLIQDGEAYRAEIRAADFSYALRLVPDAAPMENGTQGFSAKDRDPRFASHYYSVPQLKLAGTLTLAGRSEPVTGSAWLDHEWSSAYTAPAVQGWDWVGVNFDDGGALMAFRMRDAAGSVQWAAATLRSAGGGVSTFASGQVRFTALRAWRSPRSGISYPVEWRLMVGTLEILLRPLMDDQELDGRRSTGAMYWEGAVRCLAGEREIGRGYLELTGYGEKIRVG